MKTKRIVVGMLACLGMAAGLGAACPPEGDGSCAKVQVMPMHVQGHESGDAQAIVDFLIQLDPDDCDGNPILQLGGETIKLDEHVKGLLRQLHQHIDMGALHQHLQQLQIDPHALQGHLHDLKLDDHIHAALAQLHDQLDPQAIHAHLQALGVDQDVEPVLAHLYAMGQPEGGKSSFRLAIKDAEKASGNYVIAEDGNTISLTMEKGKIKSLERNGKKVDLDNVKKDGDHVKILDDNGKTVFEFDMSEAGAAMGDNSGLWAKGGPGAQNFGGQSVIVQAEPPKAMIGVQLGEPNGMLLGHFGLEAGEVTLVTGVYSGLPAAEAGVKPYDIIVSVDGKKPAGEVEVREALRGKGDGDRVTLTIIHQGERKDVKIKLVKYEQEALEKSKLDAIEPNVMSFSTGGQGGGDNVFVVPGLGQVRGLQGQDAAKWREFAEGWKQQAEEFAEKYKNNPDWREFRMTVPPTPPPPGAGHGDGHGGGPTPPGAQGADWQRLEERLERLEKMIERLAERQAERNRGGGGGR